MRCRYYWAAAVFDYECRRLTIIDPSLHTVEDYVRKELIFQFSKKMMESLFSIMHQVLGDVSEDVHHWDIDSSAQSRLLKGYLTITFANSAYYT
jgi:hypothetical protein